MNIRIAIIVGFFLMIASAGFSQVSINNTGFLPDGSSMLDVSSTGLGVLFPRMTQAQIGAIANPASGLMVYQTNGIPGLYYNAETPYLPLWLLVGNNAGQWLNNGSSIFYNNGFVGIGTSNPTQRLSVDGYIGTTNSTDYSFILMDQSPNHTGGNVGLRFGDSGIPKSYLYYSGADNVLRLNADNVTGGFRNDLCINPAGSVGIGTAAPGARFHVAENYNDYTALFGSQVGSWNTSTNVNIGDDNGPAVLYIGQNALNKGFLYWSYDANPANAYYNIGTYGGTNPLILQAAGGKVGLGVIAPEALFHVAKNGYNYTGLFGTSISSYSGGTNLSIGDDAADAVMYAGQDANHKGYFDWVYNSTPSSALLAVGTYGGANPLILQYAGGNVGIGTVNPLSRLEVDYNGYGQSHFGYSAGWQDYTYHSEQPANGDGQKAIYGFRTRDLQNDGVGYYQGGTNSGIEGFSYWGDLYSFGVSGFNFNDYTRCGGTFGSNLSGSYWGSMGYKSSGSVFYGGYFTSTGTGTTGKSVQPSSGIGLGAWGDLMGADIHGKVYGLYAEGTDYAMFSNGPVYKNSLDVHLQETSSGTNTVMYTSVSTDVTVQTSGVATLSNGRANISFDPAFAAAVSSKSPVIVTVTPIGNSNGVYLESVAQSGFSVAENNSGKSNITVNYIAIGKRVGYEHPDLPAEVTGTGYTAKMARGLHNDADTKSNGEGLYYQGGQLIAGTPPADHPATPKPAESTFIPGPSPRVKPDPASLSGSVCAGGRQPVLPQPAPSKSKVNTPASGTPVIMKYVNPAPSGAFTGKDATKR